MDKVLGVNERESRQHTLDDVSTLVELNDSLFPGTLIGIDISLVAKLHNNKNPSLIFISRAVP